MSCHLLNKISIVLIISILYLSLSQNIITSWNYDKVQMYELQKIGNILSTQIKEKVSVLDDISREGIYIDNLTLTDVQHTLYDSYLNFKTGLLLFTPNKVTFSFNFSYSSENETGSASFDLNIDLLKIRLKNNKTEQTQSTEIYMNSKEDDFSVYEIPDKNFSALVKRVLYEGFSENDYLNKYFSSNIDLISYYQDFYNAKRSLNFTTSEAFGSKNISVNFSRFIAFSEDVVGMGESALCYYSGELSEDKKDKSSVPLGNEQFVNPNDTYNTFINIDLYNEIVNNTIEDGLPEKIFNKKSAKKKLSYDFTVASLKKYFSGLEAFGNSEEFEAKIKINELNSKSTKFTASFKIGSQEDVFAIDVDMNVDLNLTITRSVRINICQIGTSNMKIKVKSGNVSILDESGLKRVVEESYNLEDNDKCLTDNGISLRDYYSIITNGYIRDEGIYLEGNQLYQ